MQFDTNYVVALSYIFSVSLVVNIEFPYRDMASGIGQKLLLLIPLIILFCKSLARVLRKRQTIKWWRISFGCLLQRKNVSISCKESRIPARTLAHLRSTFVVFIEFAFAHNQVIRCAKKNEHKRSE